MNDVDYLLAGIREKFDRAETHIRELSNEINQLTKGDTYSLFSEPNEDATECIVRLVGPPPPLRLSVITGEIMHQLRSCLDHLVCALVSQNGNSPSVRHQYPICDTRQSFQRKLKQGLLKGISETALDQIQSRQPYNSSEDLSKNFFCVLRDLNNADKHRLLSVMLAIGNARALKIGANTPTKEGVKNNINIISIYPPKKLPLPTEQGTEVLRFVFDKPEPFFFVKGKPDVKIVFGDLGTLSGEPVLQIVTQVTNKLAVFLKTFDSEFS